MLLAEHIFQLEKRLMSRDPIELANLLADDYLEFGSSGNIYDKKIQLGRPASKDAVHFTVTDFQIKYIASNVVLATYRTFCSNDGRHALRSSIWKCNENQWRMVFHQGTPLTQG